MSRKIRYSGYSRASILTPAQIFGANYYDDWDPADLGLTNGNPVSSWLSKGNNGATLTAGSGNEPTYESGVYSFPTVNGDGVADFMEVAASTGMYNFLHSGQGYVILIYRYNNTNINPILSTHNGVLGDTGVGVYADNRVGLSRFDANLVNILNGSGAGVGTLEQNRIINSQFNVVYQKFDPNAGVSLDRLNTSVNFDSFSNNYYATGGAATGNSTQNLRIFRTGSVYSQFKLARIIITDALLTPTQLSDLQTYLTATYGTFPI